MNDINSKNSSLKVKILLKRDVMLFIVLMFSYVEMCALGALQDNTITLVEGIIDASCASATDSKLDLALSLTSFTASGCNPGPGTYTVNYIVTNEGNGNFNNTLITFLSVSDLYRTNYPNDLIVYEISHLNRIEQDIV